MSSEGFPANALAGGESGLRSAVADQASAFLSAVYAWMCGGLAITAAISWFVAASPTIVGAITANGALFWGLIIAQLAIVFVLSARVQQLSRPRLALFFCSALTGVTMAFVLLRTWEVSGDDRFLTAGMFGGLAIYGTITKRDLGGLGQFLFMGLLGVVLASIVGLFWHSDGFQFVLSLAGVLVFSGLAVYDAQRPKLLALHTPAGQSSSYAIVGALALYLDFTKLFLFLRFTGSRRVQRVAWPIALLPSRSAPHHRARVRGGDPGVVAPRKSWSNAGCDRYFLKRIHATRRKAARLMAQDSQPPLAPAREGPPFNSPPPRQPPPRPAHREAPKGEPPKPRSRWISAVSAARIPFCSAC
jgi:FtsH-binding integral membrane protein